VTASMHISHLGGSIM